MASHPVLRFADLTLDTGRRSLERGGEPIELGRLTYALLLAVVESAPNVVTHDELVQRVWGGRLTSPETVTQRVKLLRDALHDDAERPRYVGLVRGQGYRLIPPVEQLRETGTPSAAPAPSDPPVAAVQVKRHRGALAALVAAVVLVVGVAAYFELPRLAGRSVALDFEITQLTTTGHAITPAISPDGKYVVYAQLDENLAPRSLWVRQVATTNNVQVVAPDGNSIVSAPTVSPDGNFIDFIKTNQYGRELWRVPFLGGTPRLLKDAVSAPVGWSPDGTSRAFVQYEPLGNTSLVTADDRGEERVLATRTVPAYFLSLNIVSRPPIRPSWSPDGRLIALGEYIDVLTHRITFIDTATGAESSLDTQGSFVPQGLGWLGPSTLVLSQPGGFGQRIQLWRMAYPSGTVTPLTNDLSSYIGVDLDASRSRLVTSRRDVRTSVWVGDATGGDAIELVPPTPFATANLFMSWDGERLLYDAMFDGRAVIAGIAPGSTIPEEVVQDAFHVAASPDGGTIVFSGATRGREGLWKVDAAGQRPVRLASGWVVEPVVTPDRAAVFISNRSGIGSPWIVPLDGGDATEIVRQEVQALDVSPDGRRLAFVSLAGPQPAMVVCELPRCSNRLELPVPMSFGSALRFTPDGKELAYVSLQGRDIWAIPLDGGAPHALTSFEPNASPILRFAWSRDGRRLAFARVDIEHDVVLLTGLRP